MKIIDFIKRQITIKNWGDACLLILKVLFVAFVINEIYDEIQYISCFYIKRKHFPYNIIVSRMVFLLIVSSMFFIIRRLKKRGRLILIFITLLTLYINGSILGIFFVDGPYWGRVVDAETGEPIEGAHVVGQWNLIGNYILTDSIDRKDIRETITGEDGFFFLPVGRLVWFWPFSYLSLYDMSVYKRGYDSLPPRMQRTWTKEDEKKRGLSKLQYEKKYKVFAKKFKPCVVKLNKARSAKEQEEVVRSYPFSTGGYKRYRVAKAMDSIRNERKRLRSISEKPIGESTGSDQDKMKNQFIW